MNKCESIADKTTLPYGSMPISAKQNLGIDALKRAILNTFREEFLFCKLFIPYKKMGIYATIKNLITERSASFTDEGQEINAVIPARYAEKFHEFVVEYDN